MIHDVLMFYAGMCFLAVFFYFLFFLYTRKRNYLILILPIVSSVLFKLNTLDVLLHYPKAKLVFLAFVIFSYCLCISEFLEFRKNLSSSSYSFFVVIILTIVGFQLFSPVFLQWQTAYTISFLLFIASVFYVPALMVYIWITRRNAQARFFFWAFFPTGVATVVGSLVEIGLLPIGYRNIVPFASSTFILALILSVVYYIIDLQNDREKEHHEKEEIISYQNILLKRKIDERTEELELEKRRSEELLIKASKKQMAELELQSLRARLNPHFMFNSLNAIQELILKEDIENAHTYLARFAKLLRQLLENAEKPFTSLQKEIDFLEIYLSLEKLRIPDLQFSITTDPTINKEKTLIPNMILQPLIENALWHGLSPKSSDKKLEVTIQKQNGTVIYDVKDNGVGRKKSAELKSLYRKQHQSKGMELLTKRFQLLGSQFGSDIQTEVNDVMINGEIGGTKVSVIVPDSLTQYINNDLHDTYNYN